MQKFTLPSSNNFALCKPPREIEVYNSLEAIKQRLNEVKTKIDKEKNWQDIASGWDMYIGLKGIISRDYGGQMTTNAWLKIYEILNEYKATLPANIRAFHLCEAPGAFVSAFHHFCFTYGIKYEWKAETLLEENEPIGQSSCTALKDNFGLITKYKDNWCFGASGNGDITLKENILYFQEHLGKFNIVTADGGVNCKDNYNDQELITSKVILGEVLTALHVLEDDGMFILKIFTCFEDITLCILSLLTACFTSVCMFKPQTSRPANSEIFLICRGFKGGNPEYYESLSPGDDGAFCNPSRELIQKVTEAMHFYADGQIREIEHMLTVPINIYIKSKKKKLCAQWLKKNIVHFLPPHKRLL